MEQSLSLNPARFEACYFQHRETVYGVALRLVGNHFEADDVTQQVFLKVWSKPNAFRGGNLAAWLTRVAHNLSIDVLRQRREIPLGEISVDSVCISPKSRDSLEDEVMRGIVARSVRRAIAHLNPQERFLIHAAFMDEETHEQIAYNSTVPLGTVKTRIRTGLRRMRPALSGLR